MARNIHLPGQLRLKWVGKGTGKIRLEEHLGTVGVQSGNLGTFSEPLGCQFKTGDFSGTI